MFRRIGEVLYNTASFGSGDVIFGVGGWVGNWELWLQPFELLSAKGFRTIAYDHHGTGETSASPELLTFDAQVDAVFQLLDDFGIDRCVLAGESNGGTVALAAALRDPSRFRGVVVVDTPTHDFDNPEARAFIDSLRADRETTIDGFVDFVVPEPEFEHLKRWLRRILLRPDVETAVALLETMFGVDLRPRLPQLPLPTQVIHGEHDPLPNNQLAVAEESSRLIEDARLHVVEGAGHVPTLTHPGEVADVMSGFIDELPD